VIQTGWIEKLLPAVLPEKLEQDKDAEQLVNNDIEDKDKIGTKPFHCSLVLYLVSWGLPP
jgi:hypothetical protein